MNQLIANFLAYLLPTSSVDNAVKGLIKAANLLAAAEARQLQRASSISKQETILAEKKAAATAEAEKAARIRTRLADLTS